MSRFSDVWVDNSYQRKPLSLTDPSLILYSFKLKIKIENNVNVTYKDKIVFLLFLTEVDVWEVVIRSTG